MALRAAVVVTAVLCLATGVTAVGTVPPKPGTEDNGLTENESATLWSRDTDDYLNESAYQRRYGEERSAMAQIANGTDITFTRPPATAATWTRNDFQDLEAGGANTTVYPQNAALENGVYITDAHATIFAVQPSTRGHITPNRSALYLAPNGTLRGFVDYRVRVPNASRDGNHTIEWALVEHEIDTVRLLVDGEPIAEQEGTHTPTLEYDFPGDGQVTLTLEAEIEAQLRATTRNRSGRVRNTTVRTERITVRDSLSVVIYDPTVSVYTAEYPNGDTGVAVFQSRPWQGYTLTANGSQRVRGVWRFYTARDTSWDTLVRDNGSTTVQVASDAIPVYVHAYPSRIGPRAEPIREGPTILQTWGTTASSPAPALGENINIDVIRRPYTASYGVAVRAEAVDVEAVHVSGIVRGVNASMTAPDTGFERPLNRSTLSATVLEQNQSHARIRVTLRSADSGEPIVLNDSARTLPEAGPERTGYITIAGQRVETNASGVAVVTVDQPGIYTARYHPGSWVSQSSAYVGDTVTVRWHPLTTLDGWFALLVEVGWQLLPFFVMFYAGKRLLRMLGPEDIFGQNP